MAATSPVSATAHSISTSVSPLTSAHGGRPTPEPQASAARLPVVAGKLLRWHGLARRPADRPVGGLSPGCIYFRSDERRQTLSCGQAPGLAARHAGTALHRADVTTPGDRRCAVRTRPAPHGRAGHRRTAREKGLRVSKATVYNTLNLFAAKGLIRPLNLDPTRCSFDSNMTPTHFHLYEVESGEILDIAPEDIQFAKPPSCAGHGNCSAWKSCCGSGTSPDSKLPGLSLRRGAARALPLARPGPYTARPRDRLRTLIPEPPQGPRRATGTALIPDAGVAQLVEQSLRKREVGSSLFHRHHPTVPGCPRRALCCSHLDRQGACRCFVRRVPVGRTCAGSHDSHHRASLTRRAGNGSWIG